MPSIKFESHPVEQIIQIYAKYYDINLHGTFGLKYERNVILLEGTGLYLFNMPKMREMGTLLPKTRMFRTLCPLN